MDQTFLGKRSYIFMRELDCKRHTERSAKNHYNKKCLLHQVLIQQNIYIVVLDKISHLQVKMVAIVT